MIPVYYDPDSRQVVAEPDRDQPVGHVGEITQAARGCFAELVITDEHFRLQIGNHTKLVIDLGPPPEPDHVV